MKRASIGACAAVVIAAIGWTAAGQPPDDGRVPGILPSGFGEAVDRDIARSRAATERFKAVDTARAAGYQQRSECVEHQPHGAMGYHFHNDEFLDTWLDPKRPEVLVYERLSDGSFQLNGVEYLVPIAAWKRQDPPTIMGQQLKRAERLGIWYLHVWNWKASPTGVFADWNPEVKCPPAS